MVIVYLVLYHFFFFFSGNTDKKRKRSRSPHDRRRSRSPRDRYRGRDFRRHSPPPRKVEMEDTAWESLTNFVFDRCEFFSIDSNESSI